jgi:hypothetical protein
MIYDNIDKIVKFDDWMIKIKNIHYPNNKAMTKAYKKINNEKI